MFGEVIGAFLVEPWERLGRPAPFQLVEFGPGRGTLMADLLRVAKRAPAFVAAARLGLVETSPRLRARQAATLAGGPLTPTWYAAAEEIPAGPLIAVRLAILTRKTLGGLETDLDGRVLRADGQPLPGLFAAGEVAGFGGGGMHGYRSLEGTFLGGCLFSGRVAGRAAAAATA